MRAPGRATTGPSIIDSVNELLASLRGSCTETPADAGIGFSIRWLQHDLVSYECNF